MFDTYKLLLGQIGIGWFFLQVRKKLKTDSLMTISEIKATLSITTLLAHYGLKAGPTGSLCCPFHDDRKSSMKIYPETNTAYCFAGSCNIDSVDVIDFIMHREKCDKRAAILRAKQQFSLSVK